MAKRKQTKGVCQICKNAFSKTGMTRHLAKCLPDHEDSGTAVSKSPPKKVQLLQILAQGKYNTDYWLVVEMPATATLRELDQFLRDIWLECCGHLSEFVIGGEHYSGQTADYMWDALPLEEESMDVPVGKVLSPGMKFTHDYDFGSTTRLVLKVVGERQGKVGKKLVRLLERNDPPEVLCEKCEKKPAVWVDVFEEYQWCCENCIENSKEGVLPLVNSPRAGVCGYTG